MLHQITKRIELSKKCLINKDIMFPIRIRDIHKIKKKEKHFVLVKGFNTLTHDPIFYYILKENIFVFIVFKLLVKQNY